MREIKAVLKEAREAIKNKNFNLSLKLCKQVLQEEKENYTALVFIGFTLQEVGQGEKAEKAFKSAIKVEPNNPLAWTGLVNYFEKIDSKESKSELIELYINLFRIEPNEKKVFEYAYKVAQLVEFGDAIMISNKIYELITSGKYQDVSELWVALLGLFTKTKTVPTELLEIQEEGLKYAISTKQLVCTEHYASYLSFLYKQGKTSELLEHAKKMHDLYQLDWISLRWICKIFNETYVESHFLVQDTESMTQYYQELNKFEKPSPTALFTKSILLYDDNQVMEAKSLLNEVVKLLPGILHAWILLMECSTRLNQFSDALLAWNKSEKLLQNPARLNLKNHVNLLVIKGLSKSKDANDLDRVLKIYEQLDDEMKIASKSYIIRINITLKRFPQAEAMLSELNNTDITYKLLKAHLLHYQEKYQEALDILENEDVAMADWWIQIGNLYWDMAEYEKSLVPYLKSAKLEPNNYKCFLLLGHYYKHFGDFDKARRCYEKAFKLNSKSEESGVELSKIYRKLKNWDANLALLQSLTGDFITTKSSWAWMELGLLYLERGEHDKAINSLRYVLRIEENNIHCLESLADAYLAKGAYTSSLKCYEKAAELAPKALYPMLQVGTIKHILGEYTEAQTAFDQILSSNKGYVPALKGMGETCMSQAIQSYQTQQYGSARDFFQKAANHFVVAIQERSDLTSLWKSLADACLFVTKLPEQFACLLLSKSLVEANEGQGSKIVEKNDLFALSIRCYCKSLSLNENNVMIWHDLGVCYLHFAINNKAKEEFGGLLERALSIAQYCTIENPFNSAHWNLLGNVALHSNPPNYRLSQHAFIKAVTADNNNAIAWSNLGTLYMILDDFKLSNEAYSQAQRSDPNYVNSWIGQALLAEHFQHEDAMDLFRHSAQLGMHQEGALGYGHWVCKTLKESPLDAVIYSIHNMHAVPVAADFLTWYTENDPCDSAAWNMLGLLRERLGLKQGALEAYRNALAFSSDLNRDKARINYGRALVKVGDYAQAVDVYNSVQGASVSSGAGLALALFKNQAYKASYEAYESALHFVSDEESFQSDILVALASMAYMFEGPEAATTLLYQSIQLEKPSPFGFFATLSLGLLHEDWNLSQLVFDEMVKRVEGNTASLAVLTGYFHLLQGNATKSVREVCKIVHRRPDEASIWLALSSLLVKVQKECKLSQSAAKCAQIAMKLGQANMDVTKVLCLVSLSSFVNGDRKSALVSAQKAVHCYPDLAEAWAAFAAVLEATDILNRVKVKRFFQHVGAISKSEGLKLWAQQSVCSV